MSEIPPTPPPPQPPQQTQPNPFNIDIRTILPTIGKLYSQFSWVIPIAEQMGGFHIPPVILKALEKAASGQPITVEEMQAIQTEAQSIQPQVGEPVLTQQLAETAYWLHMHEGKGTREIAEAFTKDGSPCSHATIARWINMVDQQKRFSKIAKLITMGKWAALIGAISIAFLIGRLF